MVVRFQVFLEWEQGQAALERTDGGVGKGSKRLYKRPMGKTPMQEIRIIFGNREIKTDFRKEIKKAPTTRVGDGPGMVF